MRSFPRRYGMWHPLVWIDEPGVLIRGPQPAMSPLGGGPAGPAGPIPGTGNPYVGMDPSDPKTWVRQYNPQPGMIGYLNFDGANVNPAQTGGPKKRSYRK